MKYNPIFKDSHNELCSFTEHVDSLDCDCNVALIKELQKNTYGVGADWMKNCLETDLAYIDEEDLTYPYRLDLIKENFEWTELIENDSWLVMNWDKDRFWLQFALVEFHCGYDDRTIVKIMWHGDGPAGNLKELRHSYFPEYQFYFNGVAMAAALIELSKHFDMRK